jgi:hypothetical protein
MAHNPIMVHEFWNFFVKNPKAYLHSLHRKNRGFLIAVGFPLETDIWLGGILKVNLYYSLYDMASFFYQFKIDKQSQAYFGFSTGHKCYQMTRLIMGVAPSRHKRNGWEYCIHIWGWARCGIHGCKANH